eukprot:scaffold280196_cov30-Tisochrysis_lutea.AAC.2
MASSWPVGAPPMHSRSDSAYSSAYTARESTRCAAEPAKSRSASRSLGAPPSCGTQDDAVVPRCDAHGWLQPWHEFQLAAVALAPVGVEVKEAGEHSPVAIPRVVVVQWETAAATCVGLQLDGASRQPKRVVRSVTAMIDVPLRQRLSGMMGEAERAERIDQPARP